MKSLFHGSFSATTQKSCDALYPAGLLLEETLPGFGRLMIPEARNSGSCIHTFALMAAVGLPFPHGASALSPPLSCERPPMLVPLRPSSEALPRARASELPILFSPPFPSVGGWRRSQTQPHAAGSLHRAGCEYGWVGSVTGPAGFTFFLSSLVPLRGWLRAS